jgi:hypothetical protein
MNSISDDINIDGVGKQVFEYSLKGVKKFLDSYIKCCEDLKKKFEYVYEGDLQAALYNSIKGSLESCEWNPSKKEWVISNSKKNPLTTFKPCLVHCEQWYRYKRNGKVRGKFIDIAIWDPTEENADKTYLDKDLLLLIELKYRFQAQHAFEAVKADHKKLIDLELKEYQKGLALTFTVADTMAVMDKFEKNKKSLGEGKVVDDTREILNEKQLRENPTQAFIVCRDGIVEITFQQKNR